jgi:tetratricopeptide (TPR) repeat protein
MSLNKSKALRTAEKYALQGKIPAAIDEYRKVVSADPGDLTTVNTLGDLYVRAGRIQDAISNFSRIANSYREGGFTLKAIAMLKKISKLDPTNIETAMKLANLYSQQGLLVEARQQYLHVADAYARSGQTRKALEAYQKIADLDPSNTSVRLKLGEIYSREAMTEQAHDAFIIAGAEFLRKGDNEQALNANLKAIAINSDSRQALTAIATIYTQQGQTDRAISVLCEAFERNPGDVELLTILGRTYLSAGMMDDAERTFLSLVELDRNRYHYLLEVGRRFLQIGDLDRAAEQIDGCIEVLIAKREEDKAIDFLRRVLDKEINHIGALKRLAQIFLRIREDHNLIATLNSLVEAAMRKGVDDQAIAALKELARLEPDEPLHLQRLYTLGVRDVVEADSPDAVRATGPLDFRLAAFDDAFVIRQLSEAEILAGHGQVDHAVDILNQILTHAPENIQVHLKLKDIYLRAGIMDKAASQCLELSRIHEGRGESARASDYLAEAHQLNPLVMPELAANELRWVEENERSLFDTASGALNQSSANGSLGFEASEKQSLDWSQYQTGALAESGFVTVPGSANSTNNGGHPDSKSHHESVGEFRYSDTLIGAESDATTTHAPIADDAFSSADVLASDTMPRVLRDELEGVDFYIAQGYAEIARDTLDRLRNENGDHPEILARYQQLGGSFEAPITKPVAAEPGFSGYDINEAIELEPEPDEFVTEEPDESIAQAQMESSAVEDTDVSRAQSGARDEHETGDDEFLIQKESGPLYPDLFVQFNTSELRDPAQFEAIQRFTTLPAREESAGTDDLIDSLVSGLDTSFDAIHHSQEEASIESLQAPTASPHIPEQSPREEEAVQLGVVDTIAAKLDSSETPSRDELQEIFDELKEQTGDLKPLIDFETHYSLGLAYKDMDLLDEAISEFQMAFRTAGIQDLENDYIHCCNMLGVCFKRKQMPKVAIMWFERGLKIPDRPEDEYQALRFEIGLCCEERGELDKAIDVFTQVYGIDVNYRKVSEKLQQLRSAKNA